MTRAIFLDLRNTFVTRDHHVTSTFITRAFLSSGKFNHR